MTVAGDVHFFRIIGYGIPLLVPDASMSHNSRYTAKAVRRIAELWAD